MNNPTDTNQASEDELDEQIRLLLQDAMGDFPTEHLLEYHTDNFKQAILDWHNKQVLEIIGEDGEHGAGHPHSIDNDKRAIKKLIKELVAEAKPEPTKYEKYNSDCLEGFNIATDEFEQNLLKALEEKK